MEEGDDEAEKAMMGKEIRERKKRLRNEGKNKERRNSE